MQPKAAAILWLPYCRDCGVVVKATEKDDDNPAVRSRQKSNRGGRRRTFSVGVMEIYAKVPRM